MKLDSGKMEVLKKKPAPQSGGRLFLGDWNPDSLFMAGNAGDRSALFLMASLAEGVTDLHAPLLVRREIGVLVAGITLIFRLMLGMGKFCRFLAGFGLQGDLGRALVGGGKSITGNSKTKDKCESGGTDNGFLHDSSPLNQMVCETGAMDPD